MFYPNTGPHDYRFRVRLQCAVTRASTEGILIGTVAHVRYGEEYAAGTCGIEFLVQNRGDVADANEYHEVKIVTPWGSDTPISALNVDTDMEAILYLYDADLQVENCLDWRFDISGLELYFENNLEYSLGAQFDSGAAFDRRMCTVLGGTYQNVSPAPFFTMPSCATPENLSSLSANPGTVGWQRKESGVWVSKPVVLDLSQEVFEPTPIEACNNECGCEDPLPQLEVDAIDQSWAVYIYGEDTQEITLGSEVSQTCTCTCPDPEPHPCGVPWSYTCQLQTVEYRSRVAGVQIAPTDAGIFTHIRETGSKCWCCEVEEPESYNVNGPNTDTESFTYAATSQRVDYFLGTQGCCTLEQAGACPPPGEGDPPVPPEGNCGYGPLECCAYRAYRSVTWEEATCGCSDPDIHHVVNGDCYIVCLSEGQVRVKWRPTQIGPWEHDTVVTTTGTHTTPTIVVPSRHEALLQYYKSGTGIVERFSHDNGLTFSTESVVAITGGVYPRVACCINGDIIRAAVVSGVIKAQFQAGGDVSPGGVFTFKDETNTNIAVENAPFGLDYAYGGRQLQGVWTVSGEGEASNWVSTDDGRTWTRIS